MTLETDSQSDPMTERVSHGLMRHESVTDRQREAESVRARAWEREMCVHAHSCANAHTHTHTCARAHTQGCDCNAWKMPCTPPVTGGGGGGIDGFPAPCSQARMWKSHSMEKGYGKVPLWYTVIFIHTDTHIHVVFNALRHWLETIFLFLPLRSAAASDSHEHSNIQTHTHTNSLSLSLSLSHTHTHTHTHTLAHTHTHFSEVCCTLGQCYLLIALRCE